MPECHAGDKRPARELEMECPGCGAREHLQTASLDAETKLIVCGHCGETWKAHTDLHRALLPAFPAAFPAFAVKPIAASPLPSAGTAKIWEEEPQPSPGRSRFFDDETPVQKSEWKGVALPVLSALSLAFLVLFVLARPAIVKAAPDLASLYGLAGLKVSADPVAFEAVNVYRAEMAGQNALLVTGRLVSLDHRSQPLQPVSMEIYSASGEKLANRAMEAPAPEIAPRERLSFAYTLTDTPPNAARIELRFADPFIQTAVAGS
ncbi:hypothetical protein NYQ83_14170 [Afifella sp. JA880]|uniref:hypothetical protein n=1 Tax=Afifella sp. JA880 TaxID=2975280 RepID=UPI0021BB7CAB|nr:hypothetical protein [Afifella sp. JA880]MCT8268423.1 hypothetical protein [Afifella sp. JA880]